MGAIGGSLAGVGIGVRGFGGRIGVVRGFGRGPALEKSASREANSRSLLFSREAKILLMSAGAHRFQNQCYGRELVEFMFSRRRSCVFQIYGMSMGEYNRREMFLK